MMNTTTTRTEVTGEGIAPRFMSDDQIMRWNAFLDQRIGTDSLSPEHREKLWQEFEREELKREQARKRRDEIIEIAMQLSWNTKLFGNGVHPPVREIADALEIALEGREIEVSK
jgi:hypothetical protein